jgi:DNA-binding PadR family transcriptional regulator
MIARKSLDTALLMIISEHSQGITGYAIIKELGERFSNAFPSSPGTIYPRLRKLADNGLIREDNKNYIITDKGYDMIAAESPNVLEKNLGDLPDILLGFMQSLPSTLQLDKIPEIFNKIGCGFNLQEYAEQFIKNVKKEPIDPAQKIDEFQNLRKTIEDTEEQFKKQLDTFHAIKLQIDDEIARLRKEEKKRVRPTIEWETDD